MQITGFPDFTNARVLVIGDLMVDHYLRGTCQRISPEAPVPVLHVHEQSYHPGGAANVAVNLASLGCQVWLLGHYGDDKPGEVMVASLQASRVQLVSPPVPGLATIVKQRMLAQGHQMLRVDFEQQLPANSQTLLEQLEELAGSIDVLVLSDYGKGTLAQPQAYIELASEQDLWVLVDPKGGDFTRYRGASLVTPNWHEFEQEIGRCSSEQQIADRALEIVSRCQLDGLLVTRGEHGMSLYRDNGSEQHVPALAREVYDVTGAGDTVIAVLAAALGCRMDMPEAVVLANHAAGIVVGRAGVASVSAEELRNQLVGHNHADVGVVSEDQLLTLIEQSRKQGECIVLTNGCFDILHAGHVHYLAQAHKLGDRLVVLINSDDSVQRLKGPGRPINQLRRRMQVIAALASVDWVCSFDENTPLRLIKLLQPDVLVKGGDYTEEAIVGAKEVQAYGGQVHSLALVDGMSTTGIIGAAGRAAQKSFPGINNSPNSGATGREVQAGVADSNTTDNNTDNNRGAPHG